MCVLVAMYVCRVGVCSCAAWLCAAMAVYVCGWLCVCVATSMVCYSYNDV